MSDFLGSRISLISKSDIRYVGTLHEINSEESTVSLENVRSFGTEGRKGKPEEEIPASDQVYEYIVFRGSDVKDLRIEEHPGIKENQPPPVPNDPAIVNAGRGGPGGQNAPPPGPGQFPPNQFPPNQMYGGPVPPPGPGQWGRGGPGPMPGPQFGNMPYPPPPGWYPGPNGPSGPPGPGQWQNQQQFPQGGPRNGPPPGQEKRAEKPQPAQAPSEPKSLAQPPQPPVDSKPSAEAVKAVSNGLPATAKGAPDNRVKPVMPLPAGKAPTGANSVQDATSAARAAVAQAMAQLGNTSANPMDNLTNKVNEMRVNAHRGGSSNRGRGRGGRPQAAKIEVPDSDFDFAQSNAKFNKDEVVKEADSQAADPQEEDDAEAASAEAAPVAYNKTSSFFDNISSEAKDRAENSGQKPGGREWRGEEQRRNMETFGQGSVDGGYRNYRGRGRGRGGRGRGGFNRGGHGGNRPQYQATDI